MTPGLLEQILAVDQQVAAAGQRREVDFVLERRDLLPAGIEIGEVVFLGIVVEQRRDPIRLREQRDIGLVDVIDVVLADGRGVGARLGAAIVLVEIVDVERSAGEVLELVLVFLKQRQAVARLGQHAYIVTCRRLPRWRFPQDRRPGPARRRQRRPKQLSNSYRVPSILIYRSDGVEER